ncbi:hypothetical protein [Halochromatium salexigens]|uniref:Uncharacterized protein n=1 Tax=Halochromatium salexigens TaxID=49447 RepID=A0AAJ0UDL9_HALSE|nr:hypothetical protein [Halochromatium salexigens]MBK5929030.1 hypothetical protein [Halochromatium salexigens]
MAELFTSGKIIDIILMLVLLEMAVLALAHRITNRTPRLMTLLPNLVAGFLLLLSLRAAIADLGWGLIALPLGLALLAHLVDLAGRWPRRAPENQQKN